MSNNPIRVKGPLLSIKGKLRSRSTPVFVLLGWTLITSSIAAPIIFYFNLPSEKVELLKLPLLILFAFEFLAGLYFLAFKNEAYFTSSKIEVNTSRLWGKKSFNLGAHEITKVEQSSHFLQLTNSVTTVHCLDILLKNQKLSIEHTSAQDCEDTVKKISELYQKEVSSDRAI
jgi:hypothetical protein